MPARGWKDQEKIQKKKILNTLKKSYPDPLSILQIAEGTGLFRHTVSKYLPSLLKEKKIVKVKIGRWDVYRIKRNRSGENRK